MALQIVATRPDPAVLTLPWSQPLVEWGDDLVVPLPRGISRHVVRFVRVRDRVYAVKETRAQIAHREYRLLRDLSRLDLPSVIPVGVVTGRATADGEPIEAALITRQLAFSVSYRGLFARGLRAASIPKVIDALVVLLTRLHLSGFFWGDCSLSNTLFRRSAGDFVAYLVDAETGELHPELSDGQRAYDLDTATGNVFAEIMDLQAGGLLSESLDPYETVDRLNEQYQALWAELVGPEEFSVDEMWRVESRIRRLNELGFDVDELDVVTDFDGATVRLQPKVVDAGHHCRRLQALTGLDVEDNQARRLLSDLDAFAVANELQDKDMAVIAHRWLTEVFEPVGALLPAKLRGTLSPAEFFHEILEHRWYLSEQAGHEVDLFDATRSYVDDVLERETQSRLNQPTLTPDEERLVR